MRQNEGTATAGWSFLDNGYYQPEIAFPGFDTAPRRPEKPRVMNLVNVAGMQYHCGEGFYRKLRVGEPARLAREQDNPHDPQAVAVFIGPWKIGYIPRHTNRAIATWLDRGADVRAEVSAVRSHQNPWNRVFVRVVVRPAA